MAFLESVLAKAATSIATGIIKQSGARLGKKLRKSETEKALERCGRAAAKALAEKGSPAGTEETLREHLEDVLGQFAEDEEVHDVLARAIREGSLPPEELAELRQRFEEAHPPETLPGFDVERGVAAFVTAFVDQAEEEPELREVIPIKELRKQTGYLREQLAEQRKQTGVLEEIRDRTPDPQETEKSARRKYLAELHSRCLMLPVTRLLGDEGLERPLTLDQVYQELDTRTVKEEPARTAEDRLRHSPGLAEEEHVSALEALAAEDHLVLLGDAGSGKSTFVRSVLSDLAVADLDEKAAPPAGLSPALVPVFIVLRELSGRLQELALDDLSGDRRSRALAEAVREQALADLSEEYRAGDFAEGLAEAIGRGRCILALDGLDEVPEDLRGLVREAVLAARDRFHPAKIAVTCRVRSYGGGSTLPGFTSHELAPFDERKIRTFCAAWYRAQGDLGRLEEGRVDTGGSHLAGQVLQPALRDLAENPLLLTTMAVIHTRKTQLPRGRAQVYEDAIQLLVRDWQKEKVGDRLAHSEGLQALLLDDSRLWPLLRRIAYEAHRVGGTAREEAAGLSKGDLWQLLSEPEHLGSAALAEEFLRYADQRAGLLVGLGGRPGHPAAFGFVHRTFQEYLAGRYLTTSVWDPVGALYEKAAEGDLWTLAVERGAEALLYVDGNPKALLKIAFGLGRTDREDSVRWQRALLWGAKLAAMAGRAAVEQEREGPVKGAAFLAELRPKLVGLLGGDLPAAERAEAGRVLTRLGDPREEVLTVDAMELCRVPAGRFVMGSPEEDDEASSRERSQHELDISYDYWIGRYPVTQAQFREFIERGGYGEERFWAGGRLSEPLDVGTPWSLPNHPVVGITWYEALAFCRWLTVRWRREGRIAEGWEVRLPSEAEWEKAARGGISIPGSWERRSAGEGWGGNDGEPKGLIENRTRERRYPWEGGFSDHLANTHETGIGTTSAVGCFPAGFSAYGCEEMAGNVWEWTRSLWGEDLGEPSFGYPYDPNDGREAIDAPDEVLRVLRGGGFADGAGLARCSARVRYLPGSRGRGGGFRLLLSPFSSDL